MPNAYWSDPIDQLLSVLASRPEGLSGVEAAERLGRMGPNRLKPETGGGKWVLFLRQFKSPITILLIASAALSFFLGERTDAFIILVIIGISALLGFYQEAGAAGALKRLLQLVQVTTTVLREGRECAVPVEETVSGDVVLLAAGNTIPGDCRLLESRDFYTNEATLTGETFPVEKRCGIVAPGAGLADRHNTVFMGTHVTSGTAKALIVRTGVQTEFGAISGRLRHLQPETEFEHGIRRLGYLLMEVTLLLVLVIFCVNVFLHKPVLDSFLFSLAIAVGLTPQLLPAIISINLAKGAGRMARQQVIVKRLASIENLGSMDVFCTDKTGTITTGEIVLERVLGAEKLEAGALGREALGSGGVNGGDDLAVFRLAYVNASLEKGFVNPIDVAIRNHGSPDIGGVIKLDELPYDFHRKRLSVLVEENGRRMIITKGAFDNVVAVCRDTDPVFASRFTEYSASGYRVLGVARKEVPADHSLLSAEDEDGMSFAGMLLFTDPPKTDIRDTLRELSSLGVALKIITGDNAAVAACIARQVGLDDASILTGPEIREMGVEALSRVAARTTIFAAIEPNQKEKILLALKRAGHVVGYMGDGINDAPALHVADAGISVNGAADVAREAADIVLLGNDLRVLIDGVREGRKTFANTLKYIFMATSANFGNMFSMAGASLFLPFLPLQPKQVLLTNLLTDIPEMTIATDSVDEKLIQRPRRINLGFIRRFMVVFGVVSSVFDYATFGVLLYWLRAGQAEFRTGWFVESVVSASLIVLVVRTSQAFYRNRPGKWLLLSTAGVVGVTFLLPFTPVAAVLGFVPLPGRLIAAVGVIVLAYVVSAETAKRLFYRRAAGMRK